MFVSARRHQQEIDNLASDLRRKCEQLEAMEQRVVEAERSRHEIMEMVRSVIEEGGNVVSSNDALRGENLRTIGHVLPYLLSGRRHWNGLEMPELADSASLNAKQLAAEYGFSLPGDPVDAVKAILNLALVLFNPALSLPLEGLKNLHPMIMNE